jgi:hypothetical protein
VLEAGQSRAGKIIGSIIFSLIWNGIVSVFLYQLISEWNQGSRHWFLAIFLVPFVLVGLATIVMVFNFILAAFNPRPRITLSESRPRLGDSLRVDWTFDGRPQRIQRLEIFLEGREEATYRRGTDTHTDREVFARIPIADTSIDYEIVQGSIELVIPDDTMHSFAGDNNKIVWSLKITGDISRWPIEVRLFWYTQGKGTRDVEVVDSLRVDNPEPSGHTRFSFQLPAGPYSFSGRLITLDWAIEAVALPG